MEGKHTPGPWVTVGGLIRTPCGGIDRGETLAHVMGNPANAALIAAAPEMYEALVWARGIVEAFPAPNDEDERAKYIEQYSKLMAALAKAEGR